MATDLPPFNVEPPLPREAEVWFEFENGYRKNHFTFRVTNGRSDQAQKDRYMQIKEAADSAYHDACINKWFNISRVVTYYNGEEMYSRKTTWHNSKPGGKYFGTK